MASQSRRPDRLKSYYGMLAGSSKMPLWGDKNCNIIEHDLNQDNKLYPKSYFLTKSWCIRLSSYSNEFPSAAHSGRFCFQSGFTA